MALSFMDPTRGRILQAYHDGDELVLQKSKLFDFSSVKTAPFELFMRHLSCKPVGNTEQFPATSVTEVVEGDFVVLLVPIYLKRKVEIQSSNRISVVLVNPTRLIGQPGAQ